MLAPLDFPEAALFFPRYSPDDLVSAYAVLGGTPAYLRQFDDQHSLVENIRDRVLTSQTYLYDEPRFLLLQEVREPRSYFAILEAMARGNTRPNEIAQAAGLGGGPAAMPYVKMLMDLRLVERRAPATQRHPHKSRKGLCCSLRRPHTKQPAGTPPEYLGEVHLLGVGRRDVEVAGPRCRFKTAFQRPTTGR